MIYCRPFILSVAHFFLSLYSFFQHMFRIPFAQFFIVLLFGPLLIFKLYFGDHQRIISGLSTIIGGFLGVFFLVYIFGVLELLVAWLRMRTCVLIPTIFFYLFIIIIILRTIFGLFWGLFPHFWGHFFQSGKRNTVFFSGSYFLF